MYRNHDLNVANRRAHETNDRCDMKQSNKTSDIFVKNHNFMRGRGIDYMKGLDPNSKFSFVKQHFNKLQKELAGISYERGMVKREPINKYASNVPSFKGGNNSYMNCSPFDFFPENKKPLRCRKSGKGAFSIPCDKWPANNKPPSCFKDFREYNAYKTSLPKSGKGYVDSDGFQYFYADDPRAYDYRMFE
jgi:hypothetical protein